MTHIGQIIEKELHRQERSVTWFARRLYCDRTNVYNIFRRQSLGTELLYVYPLYQNTISSKYILIYITTEHRNIFYNLVYKTATIKRIFMFKEHVSLQSFLRQPKYMTKRLHIKNKKDETIQNFKYVDDCAYIKPVICIMWR